MKSRDIQRYIMKAFLSDPHLKPSVPDRMEHGGTIETMMWGKFGQKSTPARSRIDQAFAQMEAFGWLRGTIIHPYGIPAWSLSGPFVKAFQGGDLSAEIDLLDLGVEEAMRLRFYGNGLKLWVTA